MRLLELNFVDLCKISQKKKFKLYYKRGNFFNAKMIVEEACYYFFYQVTKIFVHDFIISCERP